MSRFSLALLVLGLVACDETPAGKPATAGRFDAVRAAPAAGPAAGAAAASFCEKTYRPGERPYASPPLRALPGGQAAAAPTAAGGWTWVNLWATWCTPCLEEMAILGRWKDTLAREGAPFRLELLSVDAADAERALAAAIGRGLPGPVSWIRGEADFGPYLDALGVGRDVAIPIHALVDPAGDLRCVRVGAIHDRDYGTVKALLGE